MECCAKGRHSDNRGVDAEISGWGLKTGTYKTAATIHIQLKATIGEPVQHKDDTLSYFMKDVKRYNDLRSDCYQVPRILVVLFLPREKNSWLNITEDQLILKRCAYWVSLLGAPDSTNQSGQTVYLKRTQLFDPKGLEALLVRIAKRDIPKY